MNKTIKLAITSICTILVLAIILAFSTASTPKNYQHMIIIAQNPDCEDAFISIDGKQYIRHKKLRKEIEGPWDANPVINLIHQYEGEGWELQSFSGSNGNFLYYWLRREK